MREGGDVDPMGRILVLAALIYGYGGASFEGRRPDALDRPLREFHRSVDAALADGRRAAIALDDFRTMRYLANGLRPLNNAL
jgi:hypothetical protein